MTDTPAETTAPVQASVQPESSPEFDRYRCRSWKMRIVKAGLEIEWANLLKLARVTYAQNNKGNKLTEAKWKVIVSAEKMKLVDRLEDVEHDLGKAENKPGAKRKQALENIAAAVRADRRAPLKEDREWAGNSLGIPVDKLEEPPSRRAVNILISAEEDATFRRNLLSEDKRKNAAEGPNADSDEPAAPDASEPEMDDQTRRLVKRSAELE